MPASQSLRSLFPLSASASPRTSPRSHRSRSQRNSFDGGLPEISGYLPALTDWSRRRFHFTERNCILISFPLALSRAESIGLKLKASTAGKKRSARTHTYRYNREWRTKQMTEWEKRLVLVILFDVHCSFPFLFLFRRLFVHFSLFTLSVWELCRLGSESTSICSTSSFAPARIGFFLNWSRRCWRWKHEILRETFNCCEYIIDLHPVRWLDGRKK